MISYMDGIYKPDEEMMIPVSDAGFMRSHAAYQCIRFYNTTLFDFEGHYERLIFSIEALALPPLNVDLKSICEALIEKNRLENGIFRIYRTSIAAGQDQGRLIVLTQPLPVYPKSTSTIMTYPNFRTHPLIKCTHYSFALKAVHDATREGFDEVVFTDPKGNLLELAHSNFFAIKGDTLITPKDNVLPGITRKHLLLIAPSIGLTPIQETINIRSLPTFDEVFHCNTTRDVVPITRINEVDFPKHTKTLLLKKSFETYVSSLSSKSLKFL